MGKRNFIVNIDFKRKKCTIYVQGIADICSPFYKTLAVQQDITVLVQRKFPSSYPQTLQYIEKDTRVFIIHKRFFQFKLHAVYYYNYFCHFQLSQYMSPIEERVPSSQSVTFGNCICFPLWNTFTE